MTEIDEAINEARDRLQLLGTVMTAGAFYALTMWQLNHVNIFILEKWLAATGNAVAVTVIAEYLYRMLVLMAKHHWYIGPRWAAASAILLWLIQVVNLVAAWRGEAYALWYTAAMVVGFYVAIVGVFASDGYVQVAAKYPNYTGSNHPY